MWFKTKVEGKIVDVEIFRKRITIASELIEFGSRPYSCYDLKVLLIHLEKICISEEIEKINEYIINNCKYINKDGKTSSNNNISISSDSNNNSASDDGQMQLSLF